MLTIVIRDNGEPNVIKLTYENTWREVKDIPDVTIEVREHWLDAMDTKDRFVCFLESDCLVNSGYFSSQLGLFKKNPMFRKLSMLTSAVAVNQWHNKFYGYALGNNYTDGVLPIRDKKSKSVYPVQVGYVPGAIIRTNMLRNALKSLDAKSSWEDDLVYLSTSISLEFWRQGDGNPVHINPNTTYVTTEDYVNDVAQFDPEPGDLVEMFRKESI